MSLLQSVLSFFILFAHLWLYFFISLKFHRRLLERWQCRESLNPPSHQTYTYTQSNSSWGRTEDWVSTFCMKKDRHHIKNGRRHKDIVTEGILPPLQQCTDGRDITEKSGQFSTLGHRKKLYFKVHLDYTWNLFYTTKSPTVSWGNSWNSHRSRVLESAIFYTPSPYWH